MLHVHLVVYVVVGEQIHARRVGGPKGDRKAL